MSVIRFPAQPATPADDRREVAPEVDVSAEASGVIELDSIRHERMNTVLDESRFHPALRVCAFVALSAVGAALAALLAVVVRSS